MNQFRKTCFCVWTAMTVFSYTDFSVDSPKIIAENKQLYNLLQDGDQSEFGDDVWFLLTDYERSD